MKIPAFQSGLFKDVSGCLDAVALLVVTPPEGRTPIVITSLNAVDSATGQRSASAGSAPLNTEGADEAARRAVTVGSPRNPDSACILSFRYGFDAHGYSRALNARTEDLRHLGHCVRAVAE